jgi:hypothetical protein
MTSERMSMTTGDPAQIISARNAEVAKIQSCVDLTEEAKQRRINEANERAQREYAEAREAERERIQQRLESTKRAVFQVPGGYMSSDAEQAQIMAAFRSARKDVLSATKIEDRESGAQVGQALASILDEAERTGDPLLARAVYHRAIDVGEQGIVDRYLSTRPTEAQQWQRYTEAAQEAQQAASFESLFAEGWLINSSG